MVRGRLVGLERPFHVVGKWGVKKWFRVPDGLYEELLAVRTKDPHVFAAYPAQLRRFYEKSDRTGTAKAINDAFAPACLGDRFHERLVDWSRALFRGWAHAHVFRKTSLQYARRGEDASRRVAEDARVSPGVLMKHYVEVARQYGVVEAVATTAEDRLQQAIASKDWGAVAELSAALARDAHQSAG